MVDLGHHPKIKLMNLAEVREVRGFVGNFEVDIFQKARKVNYDTCTSCGTCWQKCPVKVPSEFDLSLGTRTAIYLPFAQAVPNKPSVDTANCRYINYLRFVESGAVGKKPPECRICERLCPSGSIDWKQQDEIITEQFGAIIVATGFQTFDHAVYGEYGGRRYGDVINSLQLERMLSASGPTGGEVVRPSDGVHPKTVVFVSCVGSRDDRVGRSYCSGVCCMYIAKQSILLKEHDPEVQSYVFYIDIRAGRKGYEEFIRKAQEEAGTIYLRGRVSKIYQDGKKLIVQGEDSLIGRQVEIGVDLVVLATGIEPSVGAAELAQTLNISCDTNRFLIEAHPKLRPVETQTDGVFVAGCAVGPRDIPDCVAHGSAAAAKVLGLFSKDALATNPMTAQVNVAMCEGCLLCQQVCPYKAIETTVLRDSRVVAEVNESLCKGCGLCVAACRTGALNLRGFSNEQLLEQVKALCR